MGFTMWYFKLHFQAWRASPLLNSDFNGFYFGFLINGQFWVAQGSLAGLQYPPFSYLQAFFEL